MNSMAFSQKYTIVAPIHSLELGGEFSSSEWPLHVTIADTFAVDIVGADIIQKLKDLVAHSKVFEVVGEKDAYFGLNDEVHVILTRQDPVMVALHNDVADILDGAVFNDPQYTRDGFVPHSAVQKLERLIIGEPVAIRQLALIDMFPGGDPYHRKVLAVIKFPA